MVNLIKKRIQQKKDSLAVAKSYLQNRLDNEKYDQLNNPSSEIQLILASIQELEWVLSILQQMGKQK